MGNGTPKRIIATFHNTIGHGAFKSMATGQTCDSIVPASLTPDGEWMACDKGQRADGVGIVRTAVSGTRKTVHRYFVPFSNLADLSYAE